MNNRILPYELLKLFRGSVRVNWVYALGPEEYEAGADTANVPAV